MQLNRRQLLKSTGIAGVAGVAGIGTTSSVAAQSSDGGDEQWNFETGDSVYSSPTVVDGTVYVGSNDGHLYAIDADIEGSSEDSRVNLGTLGHHHTWAGEDPPVPAEFTLSSIDTPAEIEPNEPFDVSVDVENVGNVSGEQSITLDIEAVNISRSQGLPLDGGENETVTFEAISIADAGEYEIEVASDDDIVTQAVSIAAADEATPTPTPGSGETPTPTPVDTPTPSQADDSVPGFGWIAGLSGIGGAAYVLKRRLDIDEDEIE